MYHCNILYIYQDKTTNKKKKTTTTFPPFGSLAFCMISAFSIVS